jgi:hypothetical protein
VKGFDRRAIHPHPFEGAPKVVFDELTRSVISCSQLHCAAQTVRHALIQRPLDLGRVVYAVWWRDLHGVTARPNGSWQKHDQSQNAPEKRNSEADAFHSAVHVGHVEFSLP